MSNLFYEVSITRKGVQMKKILFSLFLIFSMRNFSSDQNSPKKEVVIVDIHDYLFFDRQSIDQIEEGKIIAALTTLAQARKNYYAIRGKFPTKKGKL